MKNKALTIGLTGPTGSGKSLVAACWAAHGAAIVDADRVAREVTAPGHPCLLELAEAFSPDILRPDGSLDRHALARLAFADPDATKTLTDITHPHILALCRARAKDAAADGARYIVFDAPLLFESGLDADCDLTVAVLADPQTRLSRICARDAISEADAHLRMQTQPDDDYYIARADRVLFNDGDIDALRAQAEAMLSCA